MEKKDIYIRCYIQRQNLLTKYFGDFALVAATEKPEQLEDIYTDDLPDKISDEFREFLACLWAEITSGGGRSFDKVMNRQRQMDAIKDGYDDYFPTARLDALKVTLKERVLKANHKDVTFYKGLLKQCSEELLDTMIEDFMEDVQ